MPQADVIAPMASSGRTWLRPDFFLAHAGGILCNRGGGGNAQAARAKVALCAA